MTDSLNWSRSPFVLGLERCSWCWRKSENGEDLLFCQLYQQVVKIVVDAFKEVDYFGEVFQVFFSHK
jgi:hypothetical protein